MPLFASVYCVLCYYTFFNNLLNVIIILIMSTSKNGMTVHADDFTYCDFLTASLSARNKETFIALRWCVP